ncbi:MAG: SDR family oxidoreductase [Bacteroidetes bacterium]|nr:SDR family oxidoreductase [Bacteroidota bacterium]
MKSKKFKGEVAIVTGAGQGIGHEIAKQLAFEGASVIVNDINSDLAKKTADLINKEGGIAFAISGNSGDINFITNMVDQTVDKFGKVTIAIANAGITLHGDFFHYTESDFQKVLQVNLYGTFFLAQAVANQIKKQKSGGTILFMSSINAHQANKYLSVYAMTKAGLQMLAKNLVIELSPYNISINCLAPGATLTERTLLEQENFEGVWAGITPMGRIAYPNDIAHTALFLVSPESRLITGQTLIIDGGWTSVSPSPNKTLNGQSSVKH